MIRPLAYQPLDVFVGRDGQPHELKDPTGLPTPKQWSMLNRLGCLLVVEPGSVEPLTRADAAGAIHAARAPDSISGEPSLQSLDGRSRERNWRPLA